MHMEKALMMAAVVSAGTVLVGCSTVGCTDFGTTKYGEKARLYTLTGKGGLKMEVTDYGGRVNRLWVPDAEGKLVDVTIGFDSPAGWESTDSYFGAIIGRFGNRIADGAFTLDGKAYALAKNDTDHHACLHGGMRGWDGYVCTFGARNRS